METVTIKAVLRKERTSAKTGKPFTSLAIKTEQHGDKWLSGFGNAGNATWQKGDEVQIIVEQKGEYLNFSTPKKGEVNSDEIVEIRKKVNLIYHMMCQVYKEHIKEAVVESNVEYPANDLADQPF